MVKNDKNPKYWSKSNMIYNINIAKILLNTLIVQIKIKKNGNKSVNPYLWYK